MTSANDQFGIIWPRVFVPGSLGIVSTSQNAVRLDLLQTEKTVKLYKVRAVIGDHIPLLGELSELVSYRPANCLNVNQPPLTIYLHYGGSKAVFFDLETINDAHLSTINIEVESDSPIAAFAAARTAVNELLDVLIRSVWLPLVLVRLELCVEDESVPIAFQIHLPFAGGLSIGPLGGIHQSQLFAELESLAREGICSVSPYYRLLCAYRLYEGIEKLRGKIKEMLVEFSLDAQPPKDLKVDVDLLKALGLTSFVTSSVTNVKALHGKMTDLRNQVAHFLVDQGRHRHQPLPPLHLSDGASYQVFSMAGAALLHYGFLTLREHSMFFRQNLESRLSVGSVLPMIAQRSRYRVYIRSQKD